MHDKMNVKQKEIVDHVWEELTEMEHKKSQKSKNGNCICVVGPGSSGKTFTYQTLCHLFRAKDIKYKTSSSMGIAANLLPNGRTMHKTFGLPFGEIDKQSWLNAKCNSKLGKELKERYVLIIDEILMVSKYVIEIIDKKLRELTGNARQPFGGKTIIIGGDFKQVLPI